LRRGCRRRLRLGHDLDESHGGVTGWGLGCCYHICAAAIRLRGDRGARGVEVDTLGGGALDGLL
jgi:hypothetical protein